MNKQSIIVGVSGGIDSMVMLDILYQEGYRIIVGHVDYGKRSDSYKDLLVIEAYVKDKEIIVESLKVDSYDESNFQAQARKIRYQFFVDLAKKYGCSTLYLGHHKDDYLETYLFQQSRPGLYDAYGIKEESFYQGLSVRRVMLGMYKTEIKDYAIKHSVPYHEDSSNLELNYTRNKIRHLLQDYTLEEKEALYQEALLKNAIIDQEKEQVKQIDAYHYDVETFKQLPLNIKRRLLFGKIQKYDMTLKHIDELIRVLESKKDYTVKILDTFISVSYGTIYLLHFYDFNYTILINNQKSLQNFKKEFKVKFNFDIIIDNNDLPCIIKGLKQEDWPLLVEDVKKFKKRLKGKKVPKCLMNALPVIEKEDKLIAFAFKY